MAMMMRQSSCIGFCPHGKCICLDHLLHFVVHFPVESGHICFYVSFQLHQPPGHHFEPNPRYGQGKGRASPMWTQVGEMMNGVIMSGNGAIYVDEGAGPHNQNQGFPRNTIPKSKWSAKEIPRDQNPRLISKRDLRDEGTNLTHSLRRIPPLIHAQKCP